MITRKFTVVAQLHDKNNKELIGYVEQASMIYNKAKRETFYYLKNSSVFNKSQYNTYLQNKYSVTKRTANSIISDAQGILNSLKELKMHELKQIARKIEYLEIKLLPRLEEKRDQNSKKLQEVQDRKLILQQKNLRRKIVAKKSKLNKLKQQQENLKYQMSCGKYKLCFGTKYLLKRDIKKFREQRDHQISFIGAKSETCCNQLLQLSYNKYNNQFTIKLRKDYASYKVAKEDKYVYGKCYFNQYKNSIIHILETKSSPLSYRILKKNRRYYLYSTFEMAMDELNLKTHSEFGTIGVDFNKGFLAVTETNYYGHLVNTSLLKYRFKEGSATQTDLEQLASQLCRLALCVDKDLVIEDLNFKAVKSKTESKQGKKYNDMLHSLAYRKYVETLDAIAFRYGVRLRKVNPAWTSWLGKQLYSNTMKLNKHIAASYVIARRGQGFIDKVA